MPKFIYFKYHKKYERCFFQRDLESLIQHFDLKNQQKFKEKFNAGFDIQGMTNSTQ